MTIRVTHNCIGLCFLKVTIRIAKVVCKVSSVFLQAMKRGVAIFAAKVFIWLQGQIIMIPSDSDMAPGNFGNVIQKPHHWQCDFTLRRVDYKCNEMDKRCIALEIEQWESIDHVSATKIQTNFWIVCGESRSLARGGHGELKFSAAIWRKKLESRGMWCQDNWR